MQILKHSTQLEIIEALKILSSKHELCIFANKLSNNSVIIDVLIIEEDTNLSN